MAKILRGDVIWANLNPTQGNEQYGKRPVLIISHDIFNNNSGTVVAVALTSQPQKTGFPLTLKLESKVANKTAWIKISQVRTLAIQRLGKKIGRVTDFELDSVIEGLNEIIN